MKHKQIPHSAWDPIPPPRRGSRRRARSGLMLGVAMLTLTMVASVGPATAGTFGGAVYGAVAGAAAPSTSPLGWGKGQQVAEFSDPGSGSDRFGWAVAVSGDGQTAAVGAPVTGDQYAGAVYVFSREGGSWQQTAQLGASDGVQFGRALALSPDGTTLAVGAETTEGGQARAGAVYVFTLKGGTWTQTAELAASDPGYQDFFGDAIGLSPDGSTIVVGAWGKQNEEGVEHWGAAYIFVLQGDGSWKQVAEFRQPDMSRYAANFGTSVAVSNGGKTVAVGAYNWTVDPQDLIIPGAVYIYQKKGKKLKWKLSDELHNPSGQQWYMDFGDTDTLSISANGKVLVVGSPGERVGGVADMGALYIYKRAKEKWSQSAHISDPLNGGFSRLGDSVSISAKGSLVSAGALGQTAGGIFLYKKKGHKETWKQVGQLSRSSGSDSPASGRGPLSNPPAGFGGLAALSGDGSTVVSGAYLEGTGGMAWIFEK